MTKDQIERLLEDPSEIEAGIPEIVFDARVNHNFEIVHHAVEVYEKLMSDSNYQENSEFSIKEFKQLIEEQYELS